MRTLAAALLLALAASTLSAADKDEDKAKEVTVAFLKAVKAKDLDAVMKTVDVPFPKYQGPQTEKSIKAFIEKTIVPWLRTKLIALDDSSSVAGQRDQEVGLTPGEHQRATAGASHPVLRQHRAGADPARTGIPRPMRGA